MRLVVSIAKRHAGQTENFFELLSDGNMSLIRAVEKFDFSRGNKFSTYASWAIMKNFARSIPDEKHHRERYVTGHEEVFDGAADNRSNEQDILTAQEQACTGQPTSDLSRSARTPDHPHASRPGQLLGRHDAEEIGRTQHHQGARPTDLCARSEQASDDREGTKDGSIGRGKSSC